MSVSLRFLLACLLSLAIPVQGYAAAALRFCGPVPEHVETAAAGGHHDHAGQGDHAHHHDAAAHDDAAPPVADPAGWPGLQGLADHDCSACAACCAAAMLPATILKLPDAAPGASPLPRVRQAAAAFFTGGPERPPR